MSQAAGASSSLLQKADAIAKQLDVDSDHVRSITAHFAKQMSEY
jgi:hypothetical protein